MIKSKIDAREKALELAVAVCTSDSDHYTRWPTVRNMADDMLQYLIGSADLPETAPSAEDLVLKTMEAVNQASQIKRPLSMEAMFAEALSRKTATTSDNTKED